METVMFEKITPEKAGISSQYVADFISTLQKRAMPMHSVLLMRGDKLFGEYYWAPFTKDTVHRMYSETKSYTSVAVGLLEEEGKVELDRPMADYFPEKLDAPLHPYLARQTVREMLKMTTVGEPGSWFASDDPDRVHYYFNAPRKKTRPSGTVWEYDSAGSQVLSTLVEKLSGMSTFDYLNEKIFRHLGTFKTATMLKTRNGDSWGDSALLCTPRDMASFARFVMNYGTFGEKRLMNEEYLRAATKKQADNSEFDKVIFRNGYGYQIWCTEEGGFAFNGMGSQFTVCLPERDLIFVCTADTQGIPNASDLIVGAFFDIIVKNLKDTPLPEDEKGTNNLARVTKNLMLYSVCGAEDSPFRKELDGAEYECFENPMGIKRFCFRFDEDGKGGSLLYENAQGEKELPFGVNRNAFGKFPQLGYSNDFGGLSTSDGFKYDDAVSMAWLQDNKLMIYVQIIDRYFGNLRAHFAFRGELATVRMVKVAEDFLSEYEGELVAKRK